MCHPVDDIKYKCTLQTRVVRERREAAAAHDAHRGQDETAARRHHLLLRGYGEKYKASLLFPSNMHSLRFIRGTMEILILCHFEQQKDVQKNRHSRMTPVIDRSGILPLLQDQMHLQDQMQVILQDSRCPCSGRTFCRGRTFCLSRTSCLIRSSCWCRFCSLS